MSEHSNHPEAPMPHELEETVERVASGIERVVVLTTSEGAPRAALVSLTTLRKLDALDAQQGGASGEESDRAGLRLRGSRSDTEDEYDEPVA